jgi:hypothetical protein
MSDLQQHYDACERGMFADEDPTRCGCRGHGWFLSEVDTFHKCPEHYAGQPHPEDDEEPEGDFEPCEAPEPTPFMIATDEASDNDIPF